MLATYFVKPETVERIRTSWIGPEVERYVGWLADQGYGARSVWRRVPLVVAFGEFARQRGAERVADLPAHVDAYVAERVRRYRGEGKNGTTVQQVAKEVRGPIEQMLRLVVPGFEGAGRTHHHDPFAEAVPGFFEYLVGERGLRPASVKHYSHHLRRFAAYLGKVGVRGLHELSPAVLSAFVAERAAAGLAKTSVRDGCGVLRVFLRYAHREGVIGSDLSKTVEWPQVYRLSNIPRSISWTDVGKVLGGVDRRTPCGKRDYAILLLLVTCGLRGREVAALTLNDIDWKRERLAIPERKAGHSTAFPLSKSVGEAIVDYLQALEFRSNNTTHQPLIAALELLKRYANSSQRLFPAREDVPLAGVVPPALEELVVHAGTKGHQRVDRINYEICVLRELRERLRCKEIWVVGADRYRNPDEDLPQDFDAKRDSYYDDLGQPRDADAFIAQLQEAMKSALDTLDRGLPKNPTVKILPNGRIVVTPLVALPEPVHLVNLKGELVVRWPMTSLLDVLKETDLRVGITPHFGSLTFPRGARS